MTGRRFSGFAQFGHRIVGGEPLPDAAEMATIETIKRLRSEGMSIRAIADELNRRGLRGRAGGRWRRCTVNDVLQRAAGRHPRELVSHAIDEQGGRCAICRTEFGAAGGATGPCADHDHQITREWSRASARGILCNGCNAALGSFRDNPERMRAGAAYIEKWAAEVRNIPVRRVGRAEHRRCQACRDFKPIARFRVIPDFKSRNQTCDDCRAKSNRPVRHRVRRATPLLIVREVA